MSENDDDQQQGQEAPDAVGLRHRALDDERTRQEAGRLQIENEHLRTLVDGYRKREVETLAANQMEVPGDLWGTDVKLPDLVDEHGSVSPDKVNAAVATVLEAHPNWGRRVPVLAGNRLQEENAGPPQPRSWSDVLRPPAVG